SRGALIGLTMDANRDVITRAIFEGLALESRNTFEPLLAYPQVTTPESVVAIGGGTRNRLLMRVKASVTNLRHHIVEAQEATALGAALLGGLGAGIYGTVDDAVSAMRYGQQEIAPDPIDVPVYEVIYNEVYRRFYPSVAPLSRAISDLQATSAVDRDDA
ncbi:MAG: putative sugar kinase, partial [Thermomicrobiales bacterium]|nr:putative sugar kinase [Thermomicrobiales bacterium]